MTKADYQIWFEVIREVHAKTGNDRVTAAAWEVMATNLLNNKMEQS